MLIIHSEIYHIIHIIGLLAFSLIGGFTPDMVVFPKTILKVGDIQVKKIELQVSVSVYKTHFQLHN